MLWHAEVAIVIAEWRWGADRRDMYRKVTRSGGRSYLQWVEGYRKEAGKVRHRVVANLGRLDDLTPQKLDLPRPKVR